MKNVEWHRFRVLTCAKIRETNREFARGETDREIKRQKKIGNYKDRKCKQQMEEKEKERETETETERERERKRQRERKSQRQRERERKKKENEREICEKEKR